MTKLIHESSSKNQKNQTSASTAIAKRWMTQVATVWLVYNLSDSPWMLGVVGFTSQIPTLILLPFAGVLIDRTNRHRVIIATQILAMVQSLALAFLALTGVINIWQILILSFCQGAINAFDA
ncbi:MFS transporter, partial [Microcoleus sp. PH2017_02_FOX_O_A]|uniref:MFS transporter n=1 Tax=Microcoleus sp. PH2017_02_FOX_O_A TaxID=2798813 RepID=UPI0025EA3D08